MWCVGGVRLCELVWLHVACKYVCVNVCVCLVCECDYAGRYAVLDSVFVCMASVSVMCERVSVMCGQCICACVSGCGGICVWGRARMYVHIGRMGFGH